MNVSVRVHPHMHVERLMCLCPWRPERHGGSLYHPRCILSSFKRFKWLSRLRSSTLLAENPSSFSSDIHMVAQNHLHSRSRGSEFLFWPPWVLPPPHTSTQTSLKIKPWNILSVCVCICVHVYIPAEAKSWLESSGADEVRGSRELLGTEPGF